MATSSTIKILGPSVFCPFFNEKTLDYLFDNQAFVVLLLLSNFSKF